MLWPKMDAEYQQEIDGIVAGLDARGVAADRWDVVALNAIEELAEYYVPWLDKQQGKPPSTKAPGQLQRVRRDRHATPRTASRRHRPQQLDELHHRLALEHHLRPRRPSKGTAS